MDILLDVKNILSQSQKFTKSKNYYFETHTCSETKSSIKVQMDYIIHKENKNDSYIYFVKFGVCPHCKEVFYFNDYTSESVFGKIQF